MSDMDSYRQVFLAESADYIQQITDGLLALESMPADTEPVEVIFRGAHSLKGMSAAMGYERTADLTHKMESLMDRVRKDEIEVSQGLVDLMLAAVDLVRDLIDDESSGRSNIDPAEMLAALAGYGPGSESPAPAAEPEETPTGSGLLPLYELRVVLEESCVLKAVRAYMVLKRLAHIGRVIETRPSARDIEDENFEREFTAVLESSAPHSTVCDAALHVSEVETVQCELLSTPETSAGEGEGRPAERAARARSLPRLTETQTVRVAIGHLDKLVDLVGELVILRSRLERLAASHLDPELAETVDEMQRISAELQYEVMQTRMVPVGNIFNRFPRMVRDLAADLGKRIDFSIEGLDIELDRTVLDEIGDPLVHLLRNSIDHGIETAEKRLAAGKPEVGTVRLSACRERDHVAIVVSDDGGGIDPERVWAKAVERGIVAADERADYDVEDILLLTCLPGFSTAEHATKVSGRGVGMDVVKGKIEHLGGTIQIRSRLGQGTDFVLRLPLTVAIIKALLVECRGQAFAVPLSAIDEVVHAEDCTIDTVDGAPVVIMRDGEVVPLTCLDALLFDGDLRRAPGPRDNVLFIQTGADVRALAVEGLAGRHEIVVKPLTALFKDSRGFSGATILGDGRVLLIIDPRTVFAAAEGV